MQRIVTFLTCCALLFAATAAEAGDTVKVYILAGQSNMEGKAQNKLWEYQATAPETQDFFAHLRDGEQWIERDDVFIKFLNRKGPLTLGFGSRDRTGSEFEFGYVMGEYHDDPVLLIKTAWGGHSLYKSFRSSSNPPPTDMLTAELQRRIERTKNENAKRNRNDPLPTLESIRDEYGVSYRNMIKEVETVRAELATLFPELRGKQFELSGFFWFQGWNDQYNGAETEYEANMRHFINDVRKDLDAPQLPFVIAVMGQNQSQPAQGAMKTIQDAQLKMETLPEFRGNVKAVRTDVLVDQAAEQLYPTWKDNVERWEQVGSDHPYHYLGSAIWYTRIGRASAEALIELQETAASNE